MAYTTISKEDAQTVPAFAGREGETITAEERSSALRAAGDPRGNTTAENVAASGRSVAAGDPGTTGNPDGETAKEARNRKSRENRAAKKAGSPRPAKKATKK